MSGSFDAQGRMDPHKGMMIFCFGKKGSGKSVMALTQFRVYPYDKIVLDIAADDGPWGPDVVELHGTVDTLPRAWPEHRRHDGQPMILRYVYDPGSSTAIEDLDAVVALAMLHGKRTGHCGLLVHEIHELAPANRTPANTKRLLMHNRHSHITAWMCGPRPRTMDPLVLHQADLIYVFEVGSVTDRKHIADCIGWPWDGFEASYQQLGEHEYLRYDGKEPRPQEGQEDLRLVHFDALPAEVVQDVERWARGLRIDPRI